MPIAPRWDVRRFTTIASTNDWLLGEARAGAPAGLVAVTEHQGAGRGRMGRRWEALPGRALLASVLLRPVAPLGSLYACTAAAALAACDACEAVAGVRVGVKWPNDLVAGEPGATAKLAGILAESDAGAPGGPPGSVAVVVGIGLNADWAPEGGISLSALAGPRRAAAVRVPALLAALLDALAPRVAQLDRREGRTEILDALRRRCVTLGHEVRVDVTGAAPVTGTAVRIDDQGHLVVACHDPGKGPGGPELVVAAGDVVHLRLPSSSPPP